MYHNAHVTSQPIASRKAAYILRMFGGTPGFTYDIMVNGQPVWTAWDIGDAKQFCIDNRLSTRISNFRIEDYQ